MLLTHGRLCHFIQTINVGNVSSDMSAEKEDITRNTEKQVMLIIYKRNCSHTIYVLISLTQMRSSVNLKKRTTDESERSGNQRKVQTT